MSSTLIRWKPAEEAALTRVHARMQAASQDRAVTRRDVLVALVQAEDERALDSRTADTLPPPPDDHCICLTRKLSTCPIHGEE